MRESQRDKRTMLMKLVYHAKASTLPVKDHKDSFLMEFACFSHSPEFTPGTLTSSYIVKYGRS